ncbi:hypothetical protein [Haliangium sp.]|uniref:hypothetical protein n=1 Tax=Haliangium sp. TaxID=2663208 RepID=UPI003D12E001
MKRHGDTPKTGHRADAEAESLDQAPRSAAASGVATAPATVLDRRLAALSAELDAMSAPGPDGAPVADLDERADTVRERYSELLEEYEGDGPALTRIRALGRRIADLAEAGVLPRSLIRRGRSRTQG